jgi:hypothetical protein
MLRKRIENVEGTSRKVPYCERESQNMYEVEISSGAEA